MLQLTIMTIGVFPIIVAHLQEMFGMPETLVEQSLVEIRQRLQIVSRALVVILQTQLFQVSR